MIIQFDARARRGWFVCVVWSGIAVLVIDLLTSAFNLETSYQSLGIAAFFFFLVALFVGRRFGTAPGTNIAFIAIGIAVGMFFDAMLFETVFGQSRNLWPLGIMLYWVIGAVPVAVGFSIGGRGRA